MSRDASLDVRRAIYQRESERAFLVLLTIDHEDLNNPLRFTSDGVDTSSRGNTYTAFPFKIRLPNEESEQIPKVTLTIDNVSQEIVATVRELQSEPSVTMEVVLDNDPDTVTAGPFDLSLKDVTYDKVTVKGQLRVPAIDDSRFPAESFSPSSFPGLYSGI